MERVKCHTQIIQNIVCIFWRIIEIIFTLPRDICGLYVLIRVFLDLQFYKWTNTTVSDQIKKLSFQNADRPCFIYEDHVWTFGDVEDHVDLIHRYFAHECQLKPGDCVGLLMHNHPLYPCIWLGLSRMRVSVALLNTSLKSNQLSHAIKSCQCKIVLFHSDFNDAIETLSTSSTTFLCLKPKFQSLSSHARAIDFEEARRFPAVLPVEGTSFTDVILYIFTSGTTGMPKPAKITHNRFLLGACGCYYGQRIRWDDIIYNPLPLYHAMGGWLCVSYALLYGNTVMLKKRFSVSSFWKDCVLNNCTFFMYIGEMTRYLVASQPTVFDRIHSIRSGAGNGLRLDTWNKFLERFGRNIKLVEFYAATEGNAYFFNIEGIPGPCGFNSVFFPWMLPSIIVKIDGDTQTLVRNEMTGLCVPCAYDDPGMLVSPISKTIWQSFDGYKGHEESRRKVIVNVRGIGDAYFLTGDVIRQDNLGYYYFVDRIGDTFRWYGENVSTFEVEDVLSRAWPQCEFVVYGVTIDGLEGKCGMAATDFTRFSESKQEIQTFLQHVHIALCENLAPFARPVFVRFCHNIEKTGSFKLNKQQLKQEGIKQEIISLYKGSFYFISKGKDRYEKLDLDTFSDIQSGKIKI